MTRALSTSTAVLGLLAGPVLEGTGLGQGYVLLDGYVLALTRPAAPRMPNGVECALTVAQGQRVLVGDGRIEAHGEQVLPGPAWDPRPAVHFRPAWPRAVVIAPYRLAGLGPGLTPAGDDILCGYAAGLELFYGRDEEAPAIAAAAAARTTSLSATLLRHAARGELPEPAHALLERDDRGPLLRFGGTSGRCLLFGLAVAGALEA